MKILLLLLLLPLAFLRATDIPVNGTVRDAVDSSGVNGRITVIIGRDSTVLPINNGYFNGTVTEVPARNFLLPNDFSLKVYPSVLRPHEHRIHLHLQTPRILNKEQVRIGVYNVLGQKVNIRQKMAFQPLIIRVATPAGTASRRILAAAPFSLILDLQQAPRQSSGLHKATGSVTARVLIRAAEYRTLTDSVKLDPNTSNELHYLLHHYVHAYYLTGTVKDSEGVFLDSARVYVTVDGITDSCLSDSAGNFISRTIYRPEATALAEVSVFKEGYRSWQSGAFSCKEGATEVQAVLAVNFILKGTLANETADRIISQGIINVRDEQGRLFATSVDGQGNFRLKLPIRRGGVVNLWFSGNADYTTNTFTIIKKGIPTSIGRIGSSVGVFKPDTLTTIIDSLTYNKGIYILAFSDSSANNNNILEGIRGYWYNWGVIPWVEEKEIFYNRLLNKETGDTLPPERIIIQWDAIKFFVGGTASDGRKFNNKFITPLGITLTKVDTASGYDYPKPWEGYCVVYYQGPPGNSRGPPGYDYMNNIDAHTGEYDSKNALISEIGEGNGLYDDYTGGNGYAFKGEKINGIYQFVGFTKAGEVVWVVAHTYNSRDFRR